jgi:hypothetical protein
VNVPLELAREVLRRNARLRAWRAVGVPVEGGWVIKGKSRFNDRTYWIDLKLGCSACNGWTPGASLNVAVEAGPLLDRMVHAEKAQIWRWPDRPVCSHLAPLLGDDSPEVLAIAELELLAGEPARSTP